MDLLGHVQLDQALDPQILVGDALQFDRMGSVHILDVTKPLVDQSEVRPAQCGLYAAASIVATHDDVLHLQHLDRVLRHTQHVEIRVHHHVRHIAVDEQFAGFDPSDLLRGNPAVRATDP